MHMGKAHTLILLYIIRRSTNELGFHKCILLSHHSPLCLGLYAHKMKFETIFRQIRSSYILLLSTIYMHKQCL